jgi:c-di-GMP-binding flagellar brake protein YcgR
MHKRPAITAARDGAPGLQRRRHARVSVAGRVRLVADSSEGLMTVSGNVIDLSVSGCAIRIYTRLEPKHEARLELELDGECFWVPGHVVWTRMRDNAWMVGIRFDRLVSAKQALITRLVARRLDIRR